MADINKTNFASSRRNFFNSGIGPTIQPVDIGHADYIGVVEPDSAFWSLIKKDKLADALTKGDYLHEFHSKRKSFLEEMDTLRFKLKPSAVYFNATERCDLNCVYCYIPENLRMNGQSMSKDELFKALGILKSYFNKNLNGDTKPQIVFHGSEPMLNKEPIFAAIDKYKEDFSFGVQSNGTQLDDEAIEFLTTHGTGIGLSVDAHNDSVADRTRKTWSGKSVFKKVIDTLKRLKGYPNYNVICTATNENKSELPEIVEFFHSLEVPACMLNPVRLTLPGARRVKPQDSELAKYYLKALDRTYELYKETGRKLVVVNFANVLVSILAPMARRLMCDISPCGGGRCFFAVSAKGDIFPCSEFIGLEDFKGGNLFEGKIEDTLNSSAIQKVINRRIENVDPCYRCSIRHFCGSPCPAESVSLNGGMNRPGGFCELYEEQVRYAFRIIADEKENDYLWDNWDEETRTTINITSI